MGFNLNIFNCIPQVLPNTPIGMTVKNLCIYIPFCDLFLVTHFLHIKSVTNDHKMYFSQCTKLNNIQIKKKKLVVVTIYLILNLRYLKKEGGDFMPDSDFRVIQDMAGINSAQRR